MIQTIKLKRGTAAEWTNANPVLKEGEPGFEKDTKKLKIGDGSTVWAQLPYFLNATEILKHFATLNENGELVVDGVVIETGSGGGSGTPGRGITSITKTQTNGLTDTYTIAFTSGSPTTFNVVNGAPGAKGDPGVDGEDGESGGLVEKTGDPGVFGLAGSSSTAIIATVQSHLEDPASELRQALDALFASGGSEGPIPALGHYVENFEGGLILGADSELGYPAPYKFQLYSDGSTVYLAWCSVDEEGNLDPNGVTGGYYESILKVRLQANGPGEYPSISTSIEGDVLASRFLSGGVEVVALGGVDGRRQADGLGGMYLSGPQYVGGASLDMIVGADVQSAKWQRIINNDGEMVAPIPTTGWRYMGDVLEGDASDPPLDMHVWVKRTGGRIAVRVDGNNVPIDYGGSLTLGDGWRLSGPYFDPDGGLGKYVNVPFAGGFASLNTNQAWDGTLISDSGDPLSHPCIQFEYDTDDAFPAENTWPGVAAPFI